MNHTLVCLREETSPCPTPHLSPPISRSSFWMCSATIKIVAMHLPWQLAHTVHPRAILQLVPLVQLMQMMILVQLMRLVQLVQLVLVHCPVLLGKQVHSVHHRATLLLLQLALLVLLRCLVLLQ